MKIVLSLVLTVFVSMSCFVTAPFAAAAEKIKLTFVSSYMDRHYLVSHVYKPWMEEINKRTNGRVEITHFNPNTISPDAETYDAVVSGALDIGAGPMGRNPGKFPYATLVEMPFVVQSAESGSLAVWDLYKRHKEIQDEFKDSHVLWINTAALAHMYSTKKPLLKLEDLHEMKALAVGASQVELAKALGMVPISTSYPEAYLSLQRGMADAMIATFPILKSLKINEVTRYVTVCNLRTSGVYHVMNKERWESLPEDVKAVFNELSGDLMAQRIGHALDMSVNEDLEAFKSTKNVIEVLSPEELAQWRGKISSVSDTYIKLLEQKGLHNGQAILDDAIRLGAEWAEKVPTVINY